MSNHSFTLRKTNLRNAASSLMMDEEFYLNDDGYSGAFKDILHCFAYGTSRWFKGHKIRKEFNNYISFDFFLRGNAEVFYEHRKIVVKQGDLLVAHFKNGFDFQTGSAGMAEKLCLLLSYTPIQSAICLQLFPDDLTIVHLPNAEIIEKIMLEIGENVKGKTDEHKLLCQILMFLQELRDQLYIKSRPEPLNQAIIYLTQHGPASHIRREDLANHCGVSISTLNRLFRNYFDCSPREYIIRQRLEFAARMLLLQKCSVKQVAYEAGFSSPMFFSREFRSYYGMTPSEFRIKQVYH